MGDRIVWSEIETKLLLDVIKEQEILKELGDKGIIREEAYKTIENEFMDRGFIDKNTSKIMVKWKNLKKLFNTTNRTKQTLDEKLQVCPFYIELNNLLDDRILMKSYTVDYVDMEKIDENADQDEEMHEEKIAPKKVSPRKPTPKKTIIKRKIANNNKNNNLNKSTNNKNNNTTAAAAAAAASAAVVNDEPTIKKRIDHSNIEIQLKLPNPDLLHKKETAVSKISLQLKKSNDEFCDEFIQKQKEVIDYGFHLFNENEKKLQKQFLDQTKKIIDENNRKFFTELRSILSEGNSSKNYLEEFVNYK